MLQFTASSAVGTWSWFVVWVEEHGNAYNTVNLVSDKAGEATAEVGL
jgi:hypothetical protein